MTTYRIKPLEMSRNGPLDWRINCADGSYYAAREIGVGEVAIEYFTNNAGYRLVGFVNKIEHILPAVQAHWEQQLSQVLEVVE